MLLPVLSRCRKPLRRRQRHDSVTANRREQVGRGCSRNTRRRQASAAFRLGRYFYRPRQERERMEPSMGAGGGVDFGIAGLDQVLRRRGPRCGAAVASGRSRNREDDARAAIPAARRCQGRALACSSPTRKTRRRSTRSPRPTAGTSRGLRILNWSDQGEGAAQPDADDYTLFPEAEVEVGESLGQLFAEVDRVRPSRLVIDTISALRALAPTPAYYRRQLRRLRNFLLPYACTTIIIDDGLGHGEGCPEPDPLGRHHRASAARSELRR